MILFVAPSGLGLLLLVQIWVLLFWYQSSQKGRHPFARRLDQLLVLLVPNGRPRGRRLIGADRQDAIRALRRYRTLAELRRSARRWRVQLRAVSAQGYQVASEALSSPGDVVAGGGELVRKAVQALKAERASGGAHLPSSEDPVVLLAYGLGAWPAGADLTSLEQLLGDLGVSQAGLRNRFDSLISAVATAGESREFRELAGASFVLGASSRILEAAVPPARRAPPPDWFTAIKAHLR